MNIILAIIAGGIAGWIVERVMHSPMGVIKNILLGMFGAVIGSGVLSLFIGGFSRHDGFLAYILAGVVGGCIVIAVWRAITGRSVRA